MITTKQKILEVIKTSPGTSVKDIIEKLPERNESHVRSMITELVKTGEVIRGYILNRPSPQLPHLAGRCPKCQGTDFSSIQDGPKDGVIVLISACKACRTTWEENYTVTASTLYKEGKT